MRSHDAPFEDIGWLKSDLQDRAIGASQLPCPEVIICRNCRGYQGGHLMADATRPSVWTETELPIIQ